MPNQIESLLTQAVSRRRILKGTAELVAGVAFLPLGDVSLSHQDPAIDSDRDRFKEQYPKEFKWNTQEIPNIENYSIQGLVLVMDPIESNKATLTFQEPGEDSSLVIKQQEWNGSNRTFSDPEIIAEAIYGRMTASPGILENGGIIYLDHLENETYVLKGRLNDQQDISSSDPISPVSIAAPVRVAESVTDAYVGFSHDRTFPAGSTSIVFAKINRETLQWEDQHSIDNSVGSDETDVHVNSDGTVTYVSSNPDYTRFLVKRNLFDNDRLSTIRGIDNYVDDQEMIAVNTQSGVQLYDWSGEQAVRLELETPITNVQGIYNLNRQDIPGVLIIGKGEDGWYASHGIGKIWTSKKLDLDVDRIISTNVTNGLTIGFIAEKDNKAYLLTAEQLPDSANPTS